jgi:hypothetical protein
MVSKSAFLLMVKLDPERPTLWLVYVLFEIVSEIVRVIKHSLERDFLIKRKYI